MERGKRIHALATGAMSIRRAIRCLRRQPAQPELTRAIAVMQIAMDHLSYPLTTELLADQEAQNEPT